MKKKISIITVTRNSKDYIEETILSVINQYKENSNFNLEYLIHDGESTDGTKEIINEYSKKYAFIKFSCFKDSGLYDGLAHCLKRVTGDFSAYINAGDFYYQKSFNLINNIFNENEKINWIMGAKFFYNNNSEIIDFTKPYKYRRNLIRAGAYGKYLPFIQQESTFWRSELNALINFEYLKNLNLSGDYYIWHCFAKYNDLFVINSYLSGFKYHQNQLTFKETGTTEVYINEINKFRNKITLKDVINIVCDAPIWFIVKTFQNFVIKNSKNQMYFNIENSK